MALTVLSIVMVLVVPGVSLKMSGTLPSTLVGAMMKIHVFLDALVVIATHH